MHTLSFYSYKGGVGRSLAVYYMAEQLAKRGKKVVVADFDFEAPGLPYKFKVKQEDIKIGMVDYVHHFTTNRKLPESLEPYLVKVEMRGKPKGEVWMIPAGAAMERSYWRKMNEIDWHHLVYGQKGIGVLFFWEWKLRLETEFKPDVLLIDSRTGVTDLSIITLQLLADQAVILGVNNEENLDGCRLVMESLERAPKFDFKENPKFHFLLTRLPAPSEDFSEAAEEIIVKGARKRLNANRPESNPLIEEMIVIHSDDRLMIDEKRLINDPRTKIWRIEREYLKLIEMVYRDNDILSPDEKEELISQTDSYFCLEKAERAKNIDEKLKFLNLALEIDDKSVSAMIEIVEVSKSNKDIEKLDRTIRLLVETSSAESYDLLNFASLMFDLKNYEASIWGYSRLISLHPDLVHVYINRGLAYSDAGKFNLAVTDYNAAIELSPDEAIAYNNRAMAYLRMGNHQQAIYDVEKSLELDSSHAASYGTLSEIFSDLGKSELFYENFQKALDIDPDEIDKLEITTVARHENEPRFQELLKKYKKA
jgi:tetratricopeptide (TPR) repeat protein